MEEAAAAVNEEQYDLALDKLKQARQVFNQLSNFHLQLANSFSGINTVIFEEQRLAALEAGELRDESTYRLALKYQAKNEAELAELALGTNYPLPKPHIWVGSEVLSAAP